MLEVVSHRKSNYILVTGGAGYIGSNTVLQLREAGWEVVVADDLSTGNRRLVPNDVSLRVGNVGDPRFIAPLLAEVQPDAVIHFAGSLSVPESMEQPLKYYTNNFANSCQLVQACLDHGVDKFIFSSTAAVYGNPETQPVQEQAPKQPINPYGRSKLMIEEMLRDVANAHKFRYVALRYFNVAGADADGRAGQVARNSTNLIKVVSELAAGQRSTMTVFGDDYPTADGTCVRDFIHVTDLAAAHVAALTYLMNGGVSETMNCGYGRGYSVLEVLDTACDLVGRKLSYAIGPRRAGDPAEVIADSSLLHQRLAWTPRYDQDLTTILKTAIDWEQAYSAAV
jgi:UDP-glucose 4-epimerase